MATPASQALPLRNKRHWRWCRRKRAKPRPGWPEGTRVIIVNDVTAEPDQAKWFVDNKVRTSRYTWYNFVPVFLFQQFSRFANFYFLIICILQAFPEISLTNGVPTTAIPLACVLFFDAIVTAREDYVRHQDDARANATKTLLLRDGAFTSVQWAELKVGAVVKVNRGEEFPADLLFLSAGHEDPEQRGLCHVQTAQLDGETNLKLRQAPELVFPLLNSDDDVAAFKCRIVCDQPSEYFGRFNGTLYSRTRAASGERAADATVAFAQTAQPNRQQQEEEGPSSMQHRQSPGEASSAVELEEEMKEVAQEQGLPTSGDVPGSGPAEGTATGVDPSQYPAKPLPEQQRHGSSLLLSKDPLARGVPLEVNSTLLRGCVLRNVDYIYGAVLYTGNETKVRVKQQTTTGKKAAVEREINRNIITLLLLQILLCVAGAVGFIIWGHVNETGAWYLLLTAEPITFGKSVLRFFSFFLLISNLIPISLYVSMKLARTAQTFFMNADEKAVFINEEQLRATEGEAGRYPLRVRSLDLNDELGQISHIFSDKTGTLTSNVMEFRKCCINGVSYGLGNTLIGMARRKRLGEDVSQLERLLAENEAGPREMPHVNYIDGSEDEEGRCLRGPDGDLEGSGADRDADQAEAVHLFMLHLALNHTVILETVHDRRTGKPSGVQLSASSPDEEAFVLAAEFFGYKFHSRQKDIVTVRIRGEEHFFRIVAILPYSQMRKMMSVIVEDVTGSRSDARDANDVDDDDTGLVGLEGITGIAEESSEAAAAGGDRRYMLLSKGADSAILARLDDDIEGLSEDQVEQRTRVVERTSRNMSEWAQDGLRTLCFGFRWLSSEELDPWLERYNAALSDIDEKRKKDAHQANAIDECIEEMEWGLQLQGATGNEDKLQEGVPETIALLADAGIKIAMLTGDKQETAVNIGFATRMLSADFEQLLYTAEEIQPIEKIAVAVQSKAAEIRKMAEQQHEPSSPIGLILDEQAMDLLLTGKENRSNLLTVMEASRTVVCCRCRPDQKRQMVELVRTGVHKARTLAIGDGANDVDMILEANVGVGIIGAEGVQAANASDYSIGRFRFLQRLLLVHGRWNYVRMSNLILYMFWKNVLYAFTQTAYVPYTAWSGQKFFLEPAAQLFNLLFTGAPVLVMAVLDQDVSEENALRFPYLYSDGVLHKRLNILLLVAYWVDAAYQGILMTIFAWLAGGWASQGGSTPYIFELGTYVFTAVVLVASIRLAMMTFNHTFLFMVVLAASCLIWVPAVWIMDVADSDGCKGCMQWMFGGGTFWFLCGLLCLACLFHIWVGGAFRRWFFPDYRDIVQEFQTILFYQNEKPTLYQRCLTCGMWRQRQKRRVPPKELLARLDAQSSASITGWSLSRPKHDAGAVNRYLAPAAAPGTIPGITAAPASGVSARAPHAGIASSDTAGWSRDSRESRSGSGISLPPVRLREADDADRESGDMASMRESKAEPTSQMPPPAAAADVQLPMPPSLADIGPRLSGQRLRPVWWRPRPKWMRKASRGGVLVLPMKEDIEEDLIEWPAEQRILQSLRMMLAAGATEDEVEEKRRQLVKSRLLALVESERAQPSRAAAAAEEPLAPRPGPATTAEKREEAIVPTGGAQPLSPAPVPVRLAPQVTPAALPAVFGRAPPTAAERAAARRRRRVTATTGIVPPSELEAITIPSPVIPLSPAEAASRARKLQAVSRMHELSLGPEFALGAAAGPHRRTGSDFSIDAGHMNVYGSLLSSIGRTQLARSTAAAASRRARASTGGGGGATTQRGGSAPQLTTPSNAASAAAAAAESTGVTAPAGASTGLVAVMTEAPGGGPPSYRRRVGSMPGVVEGFGAGLIPALAQPGAIGSGASGAAGVISEVMASAGAAEAPSSGGSGGGQRTSSSGRQLLQRGSSTGKSSSSARFAIDAPADVVASPSLTQPLLPEGSGSAHEMELSDRDADSGEQLRRGRSGISQMESAHGQSTSEKQGRDVDPETTASTHPGSSSGRSRRDTPFSPPHHGQRMPAGLTSSSSRPAVASFALPVASATGTSSSGGSHGGHRQALTPILEALREQDSGGTLSTSQSPAARNTSATWTSQLSSESSTVSSNPTAAAVVTSTSTRASPGRSQRQSPGESGSDRPGSGL